MRIEWDNLPQEDLMELLQKCYKLYVKKRGTTPKDPKTSEPGDYISEAWILITNRLHDIDQLTEYIERRNTRTSKPITLATITCESIQNVARSTKRRKQKIDNNEIPAFDDTDEKTNLIELLPAPDRVEHTAILNVAITDVFKELSPSESEIFAARIEEYPYRQIASHAKKSPTAVQNNMKKIKKKLTENGISPPKKNF